jgi:anti-sigma regulatory factor (Ser/Thr protein kinase)
MRVIDLRLLSRPEAVPRARRALEDLIGIVPEACLEDARLLVSELVTNSIRHGQLATGLDNIELRADVEADALRIEVRDPGHGFQLKPRTAGSEEDSGWGLYLVGLLAERWGFSSDGSTTVWFEIPLRRGAGGAPSASWFERVSRRVARLRRHKWT